jgi:hypothetical protein
MQLIAEPAATWPEAAEKARYNLSAARIGKENSVIRLVSL